MNTPTFNLQAYKEQMQAFPQITFEEYQQITDEAVRKDIAKKNKIIQTDTYNRTMTYIKGERANLLETFTLSLRRTPNGSYNVIDGIRGALKRMLSTPITQSELDFAKDFYADQKAKGGNGYFNAEMWQNVVDRGGYLPLTIRAVADGTALKAKEPAMVVTGPSELAAIFEPDFIRPFFKSKVATDAHALEEVMQGEDTNFASKVCEQGKRAAINEEAHLDATSALIVGAGLKLTSNDAAALVYPQVLSAGTTAHRFYASYPSEDEAMDAAVEKMDKITLLTDFINTPSGTNKVIDRKERNPEKIIYPRLDSGDITQLTLDMLQRQKEAGMSDTTRDKICISEGIGSIEKIKNLEDTVREAGFSTAFLSYGSGGLLVSKDKTRDSVSAAYKLTNTAENGPTGKLSDDIDKEPTPGVLNIEVRDGVRYLVQEDEEVQGERLLNKVYENGKLFYDDNDLAAIDRAREQLLKTLPLVDFPTRESEITREIHENVRAKLLANIPTETLEEVA
ncbi:MAG: nicotinamide phosphoribosyltransferase domain-containing protein [Candidatus Peribacteria bacterium]|jgi:nicotinic acid phosphoribosyltransferase|nr:nicotinamide phosphoribosyltransferase domain-containing protein [Candidatus Peribacteria bacterium]